MEVQKTVLKQIRNETKWMKRLFTELWSADNGLPQNHTDLIFRCSDGTVSAHKTFLKEFCTTIWQIVDSMEVQAVIDPELTVIVPDFSVKTVTSFLSLLYTGAANLTEHAELESVKEFGCKHLGFCMTVNWNDFDDSSKKRKSVENSNISDIEDDEVQRKKAKSQTDPNQNSESLKTSKTEKSDQNCPDRRTEPFYLTLKKESDLTEAGLNESERESSNSVMSLDDDDDQVEFIEPDCVVDEESVVSKHANWKFNFIPEDKYTIKKLHTNFGFKYILDAPTSVMVKLADDRMTYININKFYDLVLDYKPNLEPGAKKLGPVKSVIMVVFRGRHSREEELKGWQYWHSRQSSSGFSFENKKVIEADLGTSLGIIGKIKQIALNAVEVLWDPSKGHARLAIAVQCLSTDFSEQKGVKGQPLHIQIDTYNNPFDPREGKLVSHRGYAQIKVFRDKGAQRKQRDEIKQAEKWKTKVVRSVSHLLHPPAEKTEFHYMVDLCQPPFLFRPDSLEAAGLPKVQNSFSLSGGLYPLNPFPEKSVAEKESSVLPILEAPTTAKRPRLNERVMIYAKQPKESTYSPLHVVPPTIQGLILAVKTKYDIEESSVIRNVYRKNKLGAVVQFDDDMVKFYSHEGMFVVQLSAISGQTDKNRTVYDITFTEA